MFLLELDYPAIISYDGKPHFVHHIYETNPDNLDFKAYSLDLKTFGKIEHCWSPAMELYPPSCMNEKVKPFNKIYEFKNKRNDKGQLKLPAIVSVKGHEDIKAAIHKVKRDPKNENYQIVSGFLLVNNCNPEIYNNKSVSICDGIIHIHSSVLVVLEQPFIFKNTIEGKDIIVKKLHKFDSEKWEIEKFEIEDSGSFRVYIEYKENSFVRGPIIGIGDAYSYTQNEEIEFIDCIVENIETLEKTNFKLHSAWQENIFKEVVNNIIPTIEKEKNLINGENYLIPKTFHGSILHFVDERNTISSLFIFKNSFKNPRNSVVKEYISGLKAHYYLKEDYEHWESIRVSGLYPKIVDTVFFDDGIEPLDDDDLEAIRINEEKEACKKLDEKIMYEEDDNEDDRQVDVIRFESSALYMYDLNPTLFKDVGQDYYILGLSVSRKTRDDKGILNMGKYTVYGHSIRNGDISKNFEKAKSLTGVTYEFQDYKCPNLKYAREPILIFNKFDKNGEVTLPAIFKRKKKLILEGGKELKEYALITEINKESFRVKGHYLEYSLGEHESLDYKNVVYNMKPIKGHIILENGFMKDVTNLDYDF